jgi:hypothetical protein
MPRFYLQQKTGEATRFRGRVDAKTALYAKEKEAEAINAVDHATVRRFPQVA